MPKPPKTAVRWLDIAEIHRMTQAFQPNSSSKGVDVTTEMIAKTVNVELLSRVAV